MPLPPAKLCRVACIVLALAITPAVAANADSARPVMRKNGIVKVKSAYPIGETISRLKADIEKKGIMFFTEVDQSKLAADAGIKLRPSSLLVFGNPALGSQFITSNPDAGIDWPVRLLVFEDARGQVWAVYTDFAHISRRHGIKDRDAAFKMASSVIASITSSVRAK